MDGGFPEGYTSHDSGVVFPESAPPFALVILTRGVDDPEAADELAATLARMVFDYHTAKH